MSMTSSKQVRMVCEAWRYVPKWITFWFTTIYKRPPPTAQSAIAVDLEKRAAEALGRVESLQAALRQTTAQLDEKVRRGEDMHVIVVVAPLLLFMFRRWLLTSELTWVFFASFFFFEMRKFVIYNLYFSFLCVYPLFTSTSNLGYFRHSWSRSLR